MEETSNFHSALPLILLKTLPQTKTSASLKNKLFVQTNLPVQFNPEVVNNSIINGLSFFFSTISLDRITLGLPQLGQNAHSEDYFVVFLDDYLCLCGWTQEFLILSLGLTHQSKSLHDQ